MDNTKIIFTMASPKEGTRYICRVLHGMNMEAIPNSYIQWAPDGSIFSPKMLKNYNLGNVEPMQEIWDMKLRKIQSRITDEIDLYFESEYYFIMVWCHYIPKYIKDFKVVNMIRNPALIVRSHVWRGWFVPEEEGGVGFRRLLHPAGDNLTVLEDFENASPTELAIWHVFEVNERKKRFIIDNPNVPVFDFNLETDRNEETFLRLFDFLEVERNEDVLKVVKEDPKPNALALNEPPPVYPIPLHRVQAMVDEYVVVYKE